MKIRNLVRDWLQKSPISATAISLNATARGDISAGLTLSAGMVKLTVLDSPGKSAQIVNKTVELILPKIPVFAATTDTDSLKIFFDISKTSAPSEGAQMRVLLDVIHSVEPSSNETQSDPIFIDNVRTRIVLPVEAAGSGCGLKLTFYAHRNSSISYVVDDIGIICPAGIFRWDGDGWILRSARIERQWSQERNTCTLSTTLGKFTARMPENWRLSALSMKHLQVAEHFLLSPLEQQLFGIKPYADFPEVAGKNHEAGAMSSGTVDLLAFSAGEDSTAAVALLPESTVKYFCKRAYASYRIASGHHIELQDFSSLEAAISRTVNAVIIENDFEKIALSYGFRHGYRHNFGYAAIGVLLSQHFAARSISFGSVMEQVFMGSGNNYLDVARIPTSRTNMMKRVLSLVGIDICFPTGGASEVVTNKVARASPLGKYVVSCPSADASGKPCGVCFKCFRKLRLEGVYSHQPSEAVSKIFSKHPLKSATSLMYAIQKSGYRHPDTDKFLNVDLDFLGRYHEYAIETLVPAYLRDHIRQQFSRYGVQPMSVDDESKLRSIGKVFWPEKFNAIRAGLPLSMQ
jgi:hypothetical protein